MSVLQEILEWSQDRPAWQRDALRRLVLNRDLALKDIQELAEICKGAHGLAEPVDPVPLAAEHIPAQGGGALPVSLVSIFHHRGVNALAEDQTLKFSPGLTIVYGDNGAGKTGYIRILKSACRARGQEEILGNMVSGVAPRPVTVAIKYKVGDEADAREWAGNKEDKFVTRVSVFDTQCAAVYLTEKTDVAFRPFGLDLFDKLVQACKAVKSKLEAEQRNLSTNALLNLQLQIPQGTAAARFVASVSSLTKPEAVKALTTFSLAEEARFALVEKSLLDLQANDPVKLVGQLELRSGRIQSMARHLKDIEATLSKERIDELLEVRSEGRRKKEEAKRLREATFPQGLLAGTGADSWSALWEAGRRFSQEQAYPAEEYPVVGEGAQCVFCQQDLSHAAVHRLKQFEAFVASTTERELRACRERFAQLRKAVAELSISSETIDATVKEIRSENEPVANAISTMLVVAEKRRTAIVQALAHDADLSPECPALEQCSPLVEGLVQQIAARIKQLRGGMNDEARKNLNVEAQEFRARKVLAANEELVLADIERRRKVAAYGLCVDETKTAAITQKSSAVTKTAVSQKLKRKFQEELQNLSFRHMEVELKELGGADGVFYHKLVLTRAPGVELPKVVSEGEQRCLSIAAFFAELSTADDRSGIVFDDPVSSLDFQWRQGVAQRLVQEAKNRQVIVFTHDVVFLLALRQFAEQLDLDPLDQHIRHLAKGAGVCAEELPWVALPIKRKLGYLKKGWQEADKLSRDGHQDAYEKEAKYLYGLLREGWERALEEVLLSGVVERYRPGVQTQQIARIADITEDDCKAVDKAMTKCSAWLAGHDQAAAARAPVPEPAELKADIEALDAWVASVRKRREKAG